MVGRAETDLDCYANRIIATVVLSLGDIAPKSPNATHPSKRGPYRVGHIEDAATYPVRRGKGFPSPTVRKESTGNNPAGERVRAIREAEC